jgi:hypothetical protein
MNKSPLHGKRVHLVFGYTGGGTEYFVGVFASLKDASVAMKRVEKIGRIAYITSRKIR